MSKIRLQVALAKAGTASRRKAAELIESGQVKVNGKIVREKGFRVNISKDKIIVNKKELSFENKSYYILNKPQGVLSTAKDERNRKTVLDFLKGAKNRLYPVGRLDKDTTGLIILTNDGEITFRLTHPKFGIKRVYEVKVEGSVEEKALKRLKDGVTIDGKPARAEKIILRKKSASQTDFTLTIGEGRKREIRKMCDAIGHRVLELKRIAFGPLRLKGLKTGSVRELTGTELKAIKKAIGL